MAITPRAVGAWAASNATTQVVTLATHVTGDMLIVRCAQKPYSAAPTCATSGWAEVGTAYQNGTTANGNGSGSVKLMAFWKIATSSSETNPTITWNTTSAPGCAVAVTYQKASNEIWSTPVGAGGGDATLRTSQTATISSHIAVESGDLIDFFDIVGDNQTLTVPVITQTGVTYSATTEYPATALSSGTSNDIAADGGYRTATSGTSSAAAVVTWTVGASTQGGAWQTRLRVTLPPPTQTSVARLTLADATDPEEDADHSISIRARVTTGTGVIRVALYEGANNRTGTLEATLTTSLANYTLDISEAVAATITSYAGLELRIWGYDQNGGTGADRFEVDRVSLKVPQNLKVPKAAFVGGGYYN